MADRFRSVAVQSEDLDGILNHHVGAHERVVHVESICWRPPDGTAMERLERSVPGWRVWIDTIGKPVATDKTLLAVDQGVWRRYRVVHEDNGLVWLTPEGHSGIEIVRALSDCRNEDMDHG